MTTASIDAIPSAAVKRTLAVQLVLSRFTASYSSSLYTVVVVVVVIVMMVMIVVVASVIVHTNSI
jgi:hypothetical protein